MTQPLTFVEAVFRLERFWADEGCLIWQPINTEVGAGTMNPATFLRVLGHRPWKVGYVEPSVRPDDSRYGDNPNRMQTHTQYQVILKPDTGRPVEQYLASLQALGIDTECNDIRLVEDNWESPALGAWGLGWEVWLNGLEITQFTYFQQAGGFTLDPVSVEITYGLERILMALQRRTHFKQIEYAPGVTYGDLFGRAEYEMSVYYLDSADINSTRALFEIHEQEAQAMLARKLVLPAYRQVLAMSHLFNVLDSRGAVGVAERAGFFARMRRLSHACAELWLESEEQPPSGDGLATDTIPRATTTGALTPATRPQTFLLEVGAEELPPGDVEIAIAALERAVPEALARVRLDHGAISVRATPRRLVVVVEDLAPRQSDRREQVRGPRADAAFDAEGNPTKAAIGFAARHGRTPDQLTRTEHNGQEYVVANVEEPGQPAQAVLAEELPRILEKVTFPRSMRWNASGVTFSRPIRWLLALLGTDVVHFEFAGLGSDRMTRGLRGRDQSTVTIDAAGAYQPTIRELGVTLDRDARREAIWSSVTSLAAGAGGEVPEEYRGALLEEVADLVEGPTPISAAFEERFLRLPPEVLRVVMVKHQRFFPFVREGGVLPAFVGVANGHVDVDAVRADYEAVIRARYGDAEFFYEQDLAREFESFHQELRTLTFHERLGSMLEKADRLESLTAWLSRELRLPDSQRLAAEHAARLAKNDLATQMVMEFPALAGIMGKYYALNAGESAQVAEAIRDHVRPASAGDEPPDDLLGALVGVADRLDSLVGLFAVGVKPRSTADPYGLRRAAYGLVQIVIRHEFDLDLEGAIGAAADRQPVDVSPQVRQEVLDFILRRLEVWMRDAGLAHDVVAAAIGGERSSIAAKYRTAVELSELDSTATFAAVLAAYNRAVRILPDVVGDFAVDESLFETPYESNLWETYLRVAQVPGVQSSVKDFVDAFSELVTPIDELFDNVMVMAEDPRVARNRIALLADVASVPRPIADLRQLRPATADTAAPAAGQASRS